MDDQPQGTKLLGIKGFDARLAKQIRHYCIDTDQTMAEVLVPIVRDGMAKLQPGEARKQLARSG